MAVVAWVEREFNDEVFDDREWLEIEMTRCRLTRCRFWGARLSEARIEGCHFEECDFARARLNAAECHASSFLNCLFTDAYLFLARFDDCRLLGTSFAGADMGGLTIVGGDWSWANLRHQSLVKQDLHAVKFLGADFYGADLTGGCARGKYSGLIGHRNDFSSIADMALFL